VTTIHISQCYALHINVSEVDATGQRHIRIASTFTGAKDPQDQRVLFSAVVSPEVHAQIAGALAALQQTDLVPLDAVLDRVDDCMGPNSAVRLALEREFGAHGLAPTASPEDRA